MSLNEVMSADRRGIILRLLNDQGDFGLNDGVIQDALDLVNHRISRDAVRSELEWLEEQRLVLLAKPPNGGYGLWLVTLTERGREVAEGRVKKSGVKRAEAKS